MSYHLEKKRFQPTPHPSLSDPTWGTFNKSRGVNHLHHQKSRKIVYEQPHQLYRYVPPFSINHRESSRFNPDRCPAIQQQIDVQHPSYCSSHRWSTVRRQTTKRVRFQLPKIAPCERLDNLNLVETLIQQFQDLEVKDSRCTRCSFCGYFQALRIPPNKEVVWLVHV
jgi:hypothetical protein